MSSSFERAVAVVLDHEGGFSNHPRDPGGATKYGITRGTLAKIRMRPVTLEEVQALTIDQAKAIYRQLYWRPILAGYLPAGVDLALFDFAVNSSPARAVKSLQRILHVSVDGRVGADTIAAVRAANPHVLIRSLTQHRIGFLSRLRTWPVFGRGWRRRVLAVEQRALAFAQTVSQQKDDPMFDTKAILASRTIWANLVGLAAVAVGALGYDISTVDTTAVSDAIVQLIAAASFVASTVFRILATRQIAA
jgi:lysozyme family protein